MGSIVNELAATANVPQGEVFPLMPEGQAVDMGHAADGTPLELPLGMVLKPSSS